MKDGVYRLPVSKMPGSCHSETAWACISCAIPFVVATNDSTSPPLKIYTLAYRGGALIALAQDDMLVGGWTQLSTRSVMREPYIHGLPADCRTAHTSNLGRASNACTRCTNCTIDVATETPVPTENGLRV